MGNYGGEMLYCIVDDQKVFLSCTILNFLGGGAADFWVAPSVGEFPVAGTSLETNGRTDGR